ncbi:unnamed protein product [Paramecium sonneborni]|uniref:Transmembrane protein n=1 Tax=Paramecium sonneborni TaxID=65129 RepID=A0A8S1RVB3_9CILI|nr:unnamed protein product [Paramecium sonneborni]
MIEKIKENNKYNYFRYLLGCFWLIQFNAITNKLVGRNTKSQVYLRGSFDGSEKQGTRSFSKKYILYATRAEMEMHQQRGIILQFFLYSGLKNFEINYLDIEQLQLTGILSKIQIFLLKLIIRKLEKQKFILFFFIITCDSSQQYEYIETQYESFEKLSKTSPKNFNKKIALFQKFLEPRKFLSQIKVFYLSVNFILF